MRSDVIDETGNTYGLWTVIAYAMRNGSRTYWKCQCACKTVRTVWSADLRRGGSVSCGCLPKGNKAIENRELVALNMRISQYRKAANKSGRSWALRNHECRALFKAPCFYCGMSETNTCTVKCVRAEPAVMKYNGIDRIDNDHGYELRNVVSCCFICNRAKRDLSFETFAVWLNNISGRQVTRADVVAWQDRVFGSLPVE